MGITNTSEGEKRPAGGKVLVVDDDPNNLAIISEYLRKAFLTPLVAEDGDIALRRAEFARPDLILLDIMMPGLDGYETCRRLKDQESTRDIPVIFMTALAETEHKVRGFAAGAVDYITKPFQREEVLARVGVHLRLAELTRSLRGANDSLERRIVERTAELARANHLLRTLGKCDKALIRATDEQELLEDICGIILDYGGYPLVWVGYAEYDAEQSVRVVAVKGKAAEYLLHATSIFRADDEKGQGPTVTAIRSGTPCIVRDTSLEPHFAPWKEEARRHDLGSIIALPLSGGVAVFGALTIYATESDAFHGEEATLLAELAGELAFGIKSLRAVTERRKGEEARKRLEVQLTQAQKLESVGRLAGGVAHDFNNMLSVIIGHSEIAQKKLGEDHPALTDLQGIMKAAQRSADLTRQLLAFARKQNITPRALGLNETVGEMLKLLRRLIGEDIDLSWKPGEGLWPVYIDPSQIDQLLANLCVNARDAIAGVGKVIIETRNVVFDENYCRNHPEATAGEFVGVFVSDDGCGMEKTTLAKIFEPFFTTKAVGKGTGLGLSTVYGIVKQNNGFLSVYSEPGCGSTFKVYLPRYEAAAIDSEQKLVTAPIVGGDETILLVEDAQELLTTCATILKQLGYTVLAAISPMEALQLAAEYRGGIDLLLTDVVMPEMNGKELAEKLLAQLPRLKCLFMSGYTANSIAHHGVLDEGVDFIHKPFNRGEMAAKVREVLDKRPGSVLPG